jgi:hypothetical protein
MKRKKKRRSPSAPGLGRNLALRPGGGPHVPEEEKRASDRLRREIEDQRGALAEPETSRPRGGQGSADEDDRPAKKHDS